ncbi:toll-like receptor 8 [Mytilus galloprovincialis]|uniref:Toll-like receptor 8 n=1 Tax=Mytilus galloprovincialis TaxID=29158 RepID=A0A8B6F2G2_MYTGA|nr:toll-like receptor 8 [Mytilus galloprovincialis]
MRFLSLLWQLGLLFTIRCSLLITGRNDCVIKLDPKSGIKTADCGNRNLTSVPLNLPTDINILDLSKNLITYINSMDFKRYIELTEININNNELKLLDAHAFDILMLKKLHLSSNYLNVSDSYSGNVFHSASALIELDISRNMGLDNCSYNQPVDYRLPGDRLKHLQVLAIDLVCLPKFSTSFRMLRSLKTVRFDTCFISHMSNQTFRNFPQNVKELYIKNCKKFFVVEINTLKYFPSLRILDISHTHINLIQALKLLYPFQNKTMDLINFHHVTVDNTEMYPYDVILTPKVMEYISTICIKTLDISDNNICSIRNKSLILFQYPKCFQQLILSANSFGVGHFVADFAKFIYSMTNLTLLDYSYLPLEYRNPHFLQYSQNLTTYKDDSNYNNSYDVYKTPKTFYIPKNLKHVRISHVMARNKIGTVCISNSSLEILDVSYYDVDTFPKITCDGYCNLRYLDISGMDATRTFGKFPILRNLTTLKIAHSKLYKLIPKNVSIFNWTTNLTLLDLSHNYLWYVGNKSFDGLHFMNSLNISHNMFQTVPRVIMSFVKLTELDLSYNLLSSLEDYFTIWINAQYKQFGSFKLYLQGNALLCACDTAHFLAWIFVTKASLDMDRNYTCRMHDGENNFTANIIKDYHTYFASCNSELWMKVGVSLLTAMCFCIVCITLLYNFRWKIVFYFHRKFRKIVEKGLEVNFKYDVYLSYSDDGASFIKKVLQPTIERRWGLRMCCEDRDFGVGESNVDIRASSIQKSRHIIFVITPSFITREWNRFEIERAKYEKFAKDLQKIVVIVYKTSLKNTPTELSAIWNDVCVIEWPEEGGELFTVWQKLRLWLF